MQRVNGPHKRIASALLLVIVVVAVTAAAAFGHTRHAQIAATQPPARLMGPAQYPCTATTCALNPATPRSRVNVVPVVFPTGTTPTFYAGSTPTTGMLHRNSEPTNLNCKGYARPADPDSVQFWIGGTFRGHVTYRVTDVVTNANPNALQFCLGATFTFTTASGQPAAATTLPNGLSGFVGLVPSCAIVDPKKNPCMFSKTRPTPGSKDAMLRVLVPAVAGEDPWGRA
jgi:hypothetical protein